MTAYICGNETEWNVLIVKLIKALSLTAGYAMCLLHKVPSSVMGIHLEIYCYTSVYIEKGGVFFRMRITDRCFGPYALVCV